MFNLYITDIAKRHASKRTQLQTQPVAFERTQTNLQVEGKRR